MDVPVDHSCSVVLVGDVHGQFHDVLHLLEIAGPPSANRLFVFNGDYVDRGAWGFETYFYLLSWKVCQLIFTHNLLLHITPIIATIVLSMQRRVDGVDVRSYSIELS